MFSSTDEFTVEKFGLTQANLFFTFGGDCITRKCDSVDEKGQQEYLVSGKLKIYTDQNKSKDPLGFVLITKKVSHDDLDNNLFQAFLYPEAKLLFTQTTDIV